MVKALKIFFIAILSLIIIGITIFFIEALGNKSILFFSSNESKDLVYKEEYDNTFNSIDILSKMGNIYIYPEEVSKVTIEIYGERDKTDVNVTNENVSIETNADSCTFFCFNRTVSKIVIKLPKDYSNTLSIIDNYGNVKIGEFDNINLSATLRAGDIEVTSANKLDITNNFGNISIGKVNEIMDIHENFGNIEISNINIKNDSSIRNDFGNIKIGSTNEINIKAETSLGKTKINNNYKMSEITLNIRNNFGNVTVNN